MLPLRFFGPALRQIALLLKHEGGFASQADGWIDVISL